MSTPNYVLAAVKAFKKQNNRESLKELFCNGVRLQDYPESRDLMLALMDGKGARTRGEKLQDPLSQARECSVMMEAASLYGAGMTLYYLAKDPHIKTVSMIAAEKLGCSDEHFYKRIWPKYADFPETQRQIEFGKMFPDVVLQDIEKAI